jgi:hypothetical protein
MNPIVEALGLLTPFDIDIPKRRIGPRTDGGYVFADSISASQAVVSYGIATEYQFDRIMAEAGHKVYMFDHTIEGIDATHANMMWHREGVAGVTDPASRLYTVEDHLARHGVEGDRLILKMDVEGAEFDSIGLMSDDTLGRFEQIVMEIHYLANLDNARFRAGAVRMLRKLNQHFTLFHVHANNCDGPNGLHIVSGMPVSNLLELSYVRTSAVKRTPSRTLYPTVFDYANVRAKDKLLWFFPFMPTHLTVADFGLCEDRVNLLAPARVAAPVPPVAVPRTGINIALGKPATQSSLSQFSQDNDAQGAVSGGVTGSFGFHTDLEPCPWWQVDLLEPTALAEVIVFNRIDSGADRAYSFVLKLGNEAGAFIQVHAQNGRVFGGKDGDPARIDLHGTVARYVRIELTTEDYLHLDEVEIYAVS